MELQHTLFIFIHDLFLIRIHSEFMGSAVVSTAAFGVSPKASPDRTGQYQELTPLRMKWRTPVAQLQYWVAQTVV
jgi:hypothetical protein